MAALHARWSRLTRLAAVLVAAGAGLTAQRALAQLGLSETSARNFVMNELRSTGTDRQAGIVEAGRRAFLKLPSGTRGPAATALLA